MTWRHLYQTNYYTYPLKTVLCGLRKLALEIKLENWILVVLASLITLSSSHGLLGLWIQPELDLAVLLAKLGFFICYWCFRFQTFLRLSRFSRFLPGFCGFLGSWGAWGRWGLEALEAWGFELLLFFGALKYFICMMKVAGKFKSFWIERSTFYLRNSSSGSVQAYKRKYQKGRVSIAMVGIFKQTCVRIKHVLEWANKYTQSVIEWPFLRDRFWGLV